MRSNLFQTFIASFSPLRNRNFAIYLSGQAVSLIGTWLQLTAQGWVVWTLTNSAASLGIVAMFGSLPLLLIGPWAGAWADRLDRRKLLIATQTVAMSLAFILALLVQTKAIQVWHVYALALLLGIVAALDMPAQQAFLGDLAGMGEVRKAVNLNAMIIQASRILGPAMAGFVIGALGAAAAFGLNGLSFLAVIASLIVVRAHQVRKPSSGKPLAEFASALRYVRTQPRLLDLLVFVTLMTFFGLSAINMFPAVASQVLHGDAQTLGLLMSASGVGALVGVLFIVPFAQALRRAGLVVGSAVLWMGLWFVVFSQSTWLPLSLATVFLLSLGAPTVFTMALGLLQLMAPPDMRARLLSLFVMVSFGLQPIASMWIGYSAQLLGPPTAILLNGLLLFAGAALLLLWRAELRTWRLSPQPVASDSG
jgi:MFS family permease